MPDSGMNVKLYLKNNSKQKGLIELLPSKCKALSSKLSTANKKEYIF
jgi:hypothetical protein